MLSVISYWTHDDNSVGKPDESHGENVRSNLQKMIILGERYTYLSLLGRSF